MPQYILLHSIRHVSQEKEDELFIFLSRPMEKRSILFPHRVYLTSTNSRLFNQFLVGCSPRPTILSIFFVEDTFYGRTSASHSDCAWRNACRQIGRASCREC